MIEVKQAVEIAFRLFHELYDTKKFADVMLEEIELSADKESWRVVIGFSRQIPSINIMEAIGSKQYSRSQKMFQIDANGGDLLAMKNWGGDPYPEARH
jgi:hypothetical protein